MSKYHSVKTEVDGIVFHSKKEAQRYCDLKLLVTNGDISNLELQPKYPIEVNGDHICTYIGDFLYFDRASGRQVVEDTKGFKTSDYRLKKKLVRAVYGIDILET